MAIPEYQAGSIGREQASFTGPVARTQATDFSGLQQVLGDWTDRVRLIEQAKAEEDTAVRARQAQTELGIEGYAPPEEQLAFRYQQVWKERAAATYLLELNNDAKRVNTELRQKYRYDPDGYETAWAEYSKERISAIEKQNPALHITAREGLADLGAQTWAGISDATFARDQEVQRNKWVEGIRTQIAAAQDILLDRSLTTQERDTELQRARDEAIITAHIGVDTGILNPSDLAGVISEINDSTAGDWTRGNFFTAMEREDFDAARGYINELRLGRWFENNDRARALANELEGWLNSALKGDTDHLRLMAEMADAERSSLKAGVGVDPRIQGAMEQYYRATVATGDPMLMWRAEEKLVDTVTTLATGQAMETGFRGIAAARQLLSIPQLPNGVRESLAKKLDEQETALRDAINRGDVQEVFNLHPDGVPRAAIAAGSGLPIEALPFFSTRQVVGQWDLAANTGRFGEVIGSTISSAYMQGGTAADVAHTFTLAARRGEMAQTDAAAAVAAVHVAPHDPSLATLLAQSATMPVDRDMFAATGFRFMDRARDKGFLQTINAMSNQDPRVAEAMITAYENAVLTQAAAHPEGARSVSVLNDIADQMMRSTTAAVETVKIGQHYYPTSMLGPPDAPARAAAVARHLQQRVDRIQTQHSAPIVVRADGRGGFQAFNAFGDVVDAYIPDETLEQIEQIEVETTMAQDARASEVSDPAWLRDLSSPLLQVQADRERFNDVVSSAARTARVDIEFARRLSAAAVQAPADERAIRFGPLFSMEATEWRGASPHVGQDPDYTPARQSMAHAGKLRDKYKDDAKAFAAYWGGEAMVDNAIEVAGDNWLDVVPGSVREFVLRAQSLDPDAARLMPSDIYIPELLRTWEAPIAP